MSAEERLQKIFPGLVSCPFFRITSPEDENYNCIAWAADDTGQKWWPVHWYWPPGVPLIEDIESFERAYATLGFSRCDGPEEEEGHIKIAVFAKGNKPKHAARLLRNNVWSSKLGDYEDIEHSLDALDGSDYGEAVLFMKKSI